MAWVPSDDAVVRQKEADWKRFLAAAERCRAGKRLWNRQWVLERLAQRDLLHEPIPLSVGVDFLFAREPDVRNGAAAALESAIEAASAEMLDQTERRSDWWWGYEGPWQTLRPADVASLRREFGVCPGLLGLLTMHHSGYVREAAVRELASVEDGRDLRFLLRRLNDWVVPVRDAAREVVQLRIGHGAVPCWLRLLPETIALLKSGRVDRTEVVDSVLTLLLDPQYGSRLDGAIAALPRPARADFFRRALQREGLGVTRLAQSGLEWDDPVVQLLSARKAIELASPDVRGALLLRLSRFRSMPVRRVALLARARLEPATAVSLWETALLDRHRSIRALAQASLRAAGVTDAAERYRDALRLEPDWLPPLLGLGETGGVDDVPWFSAALHSPRPSVRAAGLAGLGRCAASRSADTLLEFLHDESPRVVREAQKQLTAHFDILGAGGGDPLPVLVASLDRATSMASVVAIVDLISQLGKWRSLPALLQMWKSPVGTIADISRQAAERWFTPPRCNRIFTTPSPSERDAICATVATLSSDDQAIVQSWIPFPILASSGEHPE